MNIAITENNVGTMKSLSKRSVGQAGTNPSNMDDLAAKLRNALKGHVATHGGRVKNRRFDAQ